MILSLKIPFKEKNIKYLYCVSKYPTSLGDIEMPDFTKSFFSGYSDHTVGISAVLLAISRGAEYIEKHFFQIIKLPDQIQKWHTFVVWDTRI